MPDSFESSPAHRMEQTAKAAKPKRARRVLLIDPSQSLQPLLEQSQVAQGKVTVVHAPTIQAALPLIQEAGRIDLALVPQSPDGSGMELVRTLKEKDPATAAVMLTSTPDFTLAQQAMQTGVSDIILKPEASKPEQDWLAGTTQRILAVLDRQWTERVRSTRIRKLKRLCRKLNDARLEVTEQVDVLCNDLVTAYQELAVQVQNVTQTAGYREAVGNELDLEIVLRKTLEYILQQAGPCNAAVFLPSSADEFSLGGYVNYNCTKESADMLLEHLADVLAPAVAGHDEELIHVTDNQAMDALLGDDWNYLADCELLALPVKHDDESLAVITLFRDHDQPFTEPAIDAMSSIADQMGTLLGRIIRVHHRAMPDFDAPPPSDTFLPPSEWDGYEKEADPFDDDDGGMPF